MDNNNRVALRLGTLPRYNLLKFKKLNTRGITPACAGNTLKKVQTVCEPFTQSLTVSISRCFVPYPAAE